MRTGSDIRDLEEKGFKQIIGASDKPEDEDEKVYPQHVQDLIEKDAKISEKLQKEVIDLFIFYLTKLPRVPEKQFDDLESAYKRALEIIKDCCIFKNLKDLEFLRSVFKTLQEFISEADFPQKEDIVDVTEKAVKELLTVLKRNKPLDVYDMTLQLWKTVTISPKAEKFSDLVRTFDDLTSHVKEQHIKKEPKLFETWAPVAQEVLEKGSPSVKTGKTGKIIRSMIYDFRDNTKPQKKYEKLWIPILVNCVKWQIPVTMEAACRVIRDDQWVRCLNWKENTEAAQEILQILIDMSSVVIE
ncbi:uncharacterized protein LOC134272685 [Saccostrea cucullata]|uniref:uncharacterized protein LOC134272685 n=1 Tax=Saccostrea cuccullata TaxID=36930 RepID=UPI002ED19F40